MRVYKAIEENTMSKVEICTIDGTPCNGRCREKSLIEGVVACPEMTEKDKRGKKKRQKQRRRYREDDTE